MLLQSYDFAHLYRTMGVELQMGGADQWGNITAGLELIRRTSRPGRRRRAGPRSRLQAAAVTVRDQVRQERDRRFGLAGPDADVALRVLPVLAEHRRPRRRDLPALVHRAPARGDRGARRRAARASGGAGRPACPRARHHHPDPRGRGGRSGGRRFGGQVLGGTDRRPGRPRRPVRVGGRVHVPAGVAGGRQRDAAGGGRAPRVEGRGAPADRRRRRDDQRGTHHRRGHRAGADRRGVAGRPYRQATAGDRARPGLAGPRARTVAQTGSGAMPLPQGIDDRRRRRVALGEQDEQVVEQVGRSRRRGRPGRPFGPCRRSRPRRRPWPRGGPRWPPR